jgi:hypothetical protein
LWSALCGGYSLYTEGLFMKCATVSILVSGAVMLAAQSRAADTLEQSQDSKRQRMVQLVHCVRQRVSDEGVSYRAAIKSCKEQSTERTANPAAEELLAADAKH